MQLKIEISNKIKSNDENLKKKNIKIERERK
jgi:hypothetical protein